MDVRRRLFAAVFAIASLSSAQRPEAQAQQSGLAVAPEGDVYLVNKDINGERWTIIANVAAGGEVQNITGVVRELATGNPRIFVNCSVRPDSPCQRLSDDVDPQCQFLLQCDTADSCPDFAVYCSKTWARFSPDPTLNAGFFVRASGAAASTSENHEVASTSTVTAPAGGTADKAATLTPRLENFLASKPVGTERWSVALEVDHLTREAVVTGNVFFPDGAPPRFVYCRSQTGDDIPLFLVTGVPIPFDCLGTERCDGSPATCRQSWASIPSAPVPPSFFLPPSGLQPSTSIDLDTCFFAPPPCVQAPADPGTADRQARPAQQTCPIEAACTVSVGTCGARAGQIVQRPDGTCACEVSVADPECRSCPDVDRPCSVQVQTLDQCGNGTCPAVQAAGICQVSSESGNLLCADPFVTSVVPCAGFEATPCPTGTCCVDDAREGCDSARGDVNCGGLCVVGSSGPACFVPGTQTCPNSIVDPGEDCDTQNLGGEDCVSRGFSAGVLRCTRDCRFDTSGCGAISPECGNGQCTGQETCDSCPTDCGPCCGNGQCGGGETCQTCPQDCGVCCGSGECSGGETCTSCPQDCGVCGGCVAQDGQCNGGETCQTCPQDCGTCCGNGQCSGDETCQTCPQDCGTCCGDGQCGIGESCQTCSRDCGGCCGNGRIDALENCDALDLNGASCEFLNFPGGGVLGCDNCSFDTSQCISAGYVGSPFSVSGASYTFSDCYPFDVELDFSALNANFANGSGVLSLTGDIVTSGCATAFTGNSSFTIPLTISGNRVTGNGSNDVFTYILTSVDATIESCTLSGTLTVSIPDFAPGTSGSQSFTMEAETCP